MRVVRLHWAPESLGNLNHRLKMESPAPTLQKFRLSKPRDLGFLKVPMAGLSSTIKKKKIPPRRGSLSKGKWEWELRYHWRHFQKRHFY